MLTDKTLPPRVLDDDAGATIDTKPTDFCGHLHLFESHTLLVLSAICYPHDNQTLVHKPSSPCMEVKNNAKK